MCTNGSRSDMLTPANARRTGNPSPSKPLGAVVTDATGRSVITVKSGSGTRGRAAKLSTVTAGIEVSFDILPTAEAGGFLIAGGGHADTSSRVVLGPVRTRLAPWFCRAHRDSSDCTEPDKRVAPSI